MAFRRLLRLHPPLQLHGGHQQPSLSVLSSRFLSKKYTYNLNELIAWKKQTQQLFGSTRKPTKTGKLKKLKSVNPSVKENLETLSAVSEQNKNSSLGQNSVSAGETITNRKQKVKQSADIIEDIPDDHFVSQVFPSDAVVLKESFRDIERIPDNIILDNGDLLKDQSLPEVRSSSFSPRTARKKTERKNKASSKNYEPSEVETTNASLHSVKKQEISTKQSQEEFTEDGIFIPKIPPIPQGDQNSYSSTIGKNKQAASSSLPGSGSFVNKSTTSSEPVEPPSSFDIISKFPLVPNDETKWDSKSKEFKHDVERMSLRVLPSVKSILNKTMPDMNRFFLNRWREKMINELGEEGFKKHQEATIKKGVNLHANVMEFLSGKPHSELQIMPDNEGHWASLQTALGALGDIKYIEAEILHPNLLYRGVFDCLAQYRDMLCVIDWKTSKQPRPLLKNTYDDPLQIAAYIGAVNADPKYTSQCGQANHGVIVVAYPDGSPAHVHMMDRKLCEQYWHDWTGRLYNYYQLSYTQKIGNISASGM
ncbi:mitochondrial genome maintenance exonuclease 1 [Aplysia californica]|uniref:Mitochondrial genome maintenance exonuclease 1 n=1 Tax=Aplysia californica TaxID=6500 RepID=A0ABM0JB71_APLCA|nr:mitochondrial genome maintenance exonuclease 1 [Aplysia californica]